MKETELDVKQLRLTDYMPVHKIAALVDILKERRLKAGENAYSGIAKGWVYRRCGSKKPDETL